MSTSSAPEPRPRPLSECEDVYDVLREIALRPRMWVRSLSELEALLWGYGTALQVHGIAEPYPFNSSRAFSDWLRARFGWGMAPGWARAIEEHAGDEEPFEVFFRLVEEYRLDQLPDARACGAVHLDADCPVAVTEARPGGVRASRSAGTGRATG